MTPDLGQGGCQALEDAVALGRCLGAADEVALALRCYDKLRRGRAQRIADASRRSAAHNRDHGVLTALATGLAVRAMPAALWRKSVSQWL